MEQEKSMKSVQAGSIAVSPRHITVAMRSIMNAGSKSCMGTTGAGAECKSFRVKGTDYCAAHQKKQGVARDVGSDQMKAGDFKISDGGERGDSDGQIAELREMMLAMKGDMKKSLEKLQADWAVRVEKLEGVVELNTVANAEHNLKIRQLQKELAAAQLEGKQWMELCHVKVMSHNTELERMGKLVKQLVDKDSMDAEIPPAFDLVYMEQGVKELKDKLAKMDASMAKMEAQPQMVAAVAELKASVAELRAQPKTFASVVGKGGGSVEGGQSKVGTAAYTASGDGNHLRFTITGLNTEGKRNEVQLAELVKGKIQELLKISVTLQEVRLLPLKPGAAAESRKVMFTVLTPMDAKAITYQRTQLAGSGITIRDDLSKEELALQNQVWPAFKQARADGKSAHFLRAKLYVNGLWVKPTPAV